MIKFRSFLSYFLDVVSTPAFVFKTILFSILFLLFSAILINIINIFNFALNDYSIFTKFNIILKFITGAFNTISTRDIVMLIIISFLFGINISLVLEKIEFVKKQKNLRVTFGAGIISIATAGCASCGLSIVSFVGLGAVLALLPFGGFELYIIAVLILIASIIYNINSIYKACAL